jgi:phthiocerol/phenolphthiocerol synthesis type-I polyketide synthase E
LPRLVAGQPLDFLLLCSSITGVLGGTGQVDYCAANAYLDAFVQEHPDLPVLAIGWDAWREIGMAVETKVPADMQQARAMQLRDGLSNKEGADAFDRILASGLRNVVVSTHDLNVLVAGSRPKPEMASAPSAQQTQAPAASKHARPDVQTAFASTRNDIDTVLLGMWEDVLGIQGIGINDNFFDLGGHSLLATQVLSRINDVFQVNLPLRIMFDAATVSELSDYLANNDKQPGRVTKIAAVLRKIEGMSTEEVADALNRRGAAVS